MRNSSYNKMYLPDGAWADEMTQSTTVSEIKGHLEFAVCDMHVH